MCIIVQGILSMSMCYDDFVRRLKEERINHQLTLRAMSKMVRVLPSHYLKIENGYNRLTFYELENICSTDLDIYYIFTGRRCMTGNRYEEVLKNAEVEQIICCLQVIHLVAGRKRKKGSYKDEWEQIYSEIKYLMYVDIGLADERNIFKAYREYNGVTQLSFAEELGMDVKKLRLLECDKVIPDSEIIFKMYEKFGISPSAFLRHKKCIQSEIAYLLNSYTGKVGEELLVIVKTVMLFVE